MHNGLKKEYALMWKRRTQKMKLCHEPLKMLDYKNHRLWDFF